MEKNEKNVKWFIIGGIVCVLAILFAVGPVLVTRYMRAKWQNAPKYKVSSLLMNISGELKKSNDSNYYVKGDNGLFYVLENIKQDLTEKIDMKCDVVGSFRQAINDEKIDGNPVRLFISVNKIAFPELGETISDEVDDSKQEEKAAAAKEKALQKAKIRVAVNAALGKSILFDVVKGNIASISRKDRDNKDFTAFVLTDDFNDRYMLYKKGKDLSLLDGKRVIVLGREIIPPSNFPLFVDETTFEIYEVYDLDYNKK